MKWLRKKRTLLLTLGILIAALVGWSFWTSRPPKITFLKFRSSPNGMWMDLELENCPKGRIDSSAVQMPYCQVQASSGWVPVESFPKNLKPTTFRICRLQFRHGERVSIEAEVPRGVDGRYPFPFRVGIAYWRPNSLMTGAILKLFGTGAFQPTPEIAWSDPITAEHLEASSGPPLLPRE